MSIDSTMRRLAAGKRPNGKVPMINAKHPGTPVRFTSAPTPRHNLYKRTDNKRII
jgi:hypothetical protein